MNILVISSSPNLDGLTAACAAAAVDGVKQAGGNASEIRLCDLNVDKCHQCGNGWGTCFNDHVCQELDDFQALHTQILQADGLVIVTPVYWGEPSEASKALLDRLRRCEATRKPESLLKSKPVICVAAAGGSGNGTITCLLSLENWCKHVQLRVFDLIPINRWTRPYKLESIRSAAALMIKI